MIQATITFKRLLQSLAGIAACALSACAVTPAPEPLYDYGMGQFRTIAEWQGIRTVGQATPEPLMDYGVALLDSPAPDAASGRSPVGRVDPSRLASR